MAIAFSEKVAVEGHKYVGVEVGGHRSALLLPNEYKDERLQEALDFVYRTLCSSCYTQMVIADNFVILAYDIFANRKMMKFNFKKDFLQMQSYLRKTMRLYERHMDDVYYNEYSMTLYENVSELIEKLRKFIEDKLRNLGVKNAYDSSFAVMIQNLIQCIGDTFSDVMRITKRDYDINLSDAYKYYNPKMAFSKADCVVEDIMHENARVFEKDIINSKTVIAIWSEIIKKIYDEKLQTKARIAAYENMPKEQQELYTLDEKGFCILKEGVKVYRKEAQDV